MYISYTPNPIDKFIIDDMVFFRLSYSESSVTYGCTPASENGTIYNRETFLKMNR